MGHFLLTFSAFAFIFLGIQDGLAQSQKYDYRYTALGAGLKASYFDGDIRTPYKYIRPGIGVSILRKISPRLTLYSELMWIRVMGDDYEEGYLNNSRRLPEFIRNLHFRNDIKEWSGGVRYDAFPCTGHYRKRPLLNVYGSIGMALLYHNPQAQIFKDSTLSSTRWIPLRPLRTENAYYSNIVLSIPLAAGLRYKLSMNWDIEAEISYHYTFSDYIDDVSSVYPDPVTMKNSTARQMSFRSADPQSALSGNTRDLMYMERELDHSIISGADYSYVQGQGPGDARGTRKGNDGIVIFSVRVLYVLPDRINCPRYREFD